MGGWVLEIEAGRKGLKGGARGGWLGVVCVLGIGGVEWVNGWIS